jgi:DNA-binding NtrC family response regulator
VVTINLPPLRERVNDIPLLAQAFLKELAAENNKPVDAIAPDVMQVLLAYPWPGNVRELRNVIERMVVLARGKQLTERDLPPNIQAGVAGQALAGGKAATSLEEANRRMILAALETQKGNRTRVAAQLGISRRTLLRKLHEFGLLPAKETIKQPEQLTAKIAKNTEKKTNTI